MVTRATIIDLMTQRAKSKGAEWARLNRLIAKAQRELDNQAKVAPSPARSAAIAALNSKD